MRIEDAFIARSESMRKVLHVVSRVAPSDVTVLIRGETGTGKELIARELHRQSRRSDAPFIAVNCAAVPSGLMESELFGHERGSFTGANDRRLGKFEIAEGGTILLDEITEMDVALQPKLLRYLQEREFYRVGGTRPIRSNVRVLATTNVDIERFIEAKRFRPDLYYRLAVVEVTVPPLRNRREEIPDLADELLSGFREKLDLQNMIISAEAKRVLCWHPWPGNVRELENVIKRTALLCDGPIIQASALPDCIVHGRTRESHLTVDEPTMTLEEVERQYIMQVLNYTGGHKRKTAAILDVDGSTLYRKLVRYGIESVDGTIGGWDGRRMGRSLMSVVGGGYTQAGR